MVCHRGATAGTRGRKLARTLERKGRLCLVFALDQHARCLAVAVAMNGCPSLLLNLAAPGAGALATLRRLRASSEGGALSFAARAADALSAQTVGRRFFHEFRSTLERLGGGLPRPIPDLDRQNLALLQLTRVLFLYFVQTKGWLGGRDRFMAEEVDFSWAPSIALLPQAPRENRRPESGASCSGTSSE